MIDDCLAAKKILDSGATCVLCYKGMVLRNDKEGLTPLFEFIDSKFDFTMFSSAINKIDKASAFLYLKLGIKNLICYNITKSALDLLEKSNVEIHYNELIEINSKLEEELKDVFDIDLAYQIIKKY